MRIKSALAFVLIGYLVILSTSFADLPTTPTINTPSNGSTVYTSPVTLNVSSTATDLGLAYYFYGGPSPTTMSYLGIGDSLDYSHYKNITISTNGSNVSATFQMKINVTYEPQMQADFDDIRFYHKNGTALSYWLDDKVDSDYANVWVKLLDAITDPGSDYIYMTYGNATISSGSSGTAVFTYFGLDENITGFSYSGNAPTASTTQVKRGTYSIRINADAGAASYLYNSSKMSDNSVYELDIYDTASDTSLQNSFWLALNSVDKGILFVHTTTSTTNYTTRDGGGSATTIPRSTGWHQARMVLNGTHMLMYIDNVLVRTITYTYTSPVQRIGDTTVDAMFGLTYIDSYRVRKYVVNEPTSTIGSGIPVSTGVKSWSISSSGIYYWTAKSQSEAGNSSNMSTAQFTLVLTPTLLTPTNGSTISTTFPPITSSTSFSWTDVGATQYRLEVAEDTSFKVMVVDTYVATNSSTQSIQVGKTYYWRVTPYEGAIVGIASSTFNFQITASTPSTSTAIHGVVYELVNGVQTPVSNALVVATNTTRTYTALTGSNGYYLFDNLKANDTYTVAASKEEYKPSITNYVTPAHNNWSLQNILLEPVVEEVFRHYVRFTVQNIWGTRKYSNVAVTVYKYGELTTYRSGSTGSDGTATFQLYKNQKYTITFTNATLGISITKTLYPQDDNYIIIIPSTSSKYTEHDTPISSGITASVSKSEINTTSAYINVSYADSLAQTTSLIVYINQTNVTDPHNQTTIMSWNAGAVSNTSHSFIITNYAGENYLVHFKIVHTTYGSISKIYGVSFKNTVSFPGVPQSAWLYFAIIIMMFTAGIFSYSNIPIGMILLGVEGLVFNTFAWFDTLPGNGGSTIVTGSLIVIVFGVLIYLSRSANKEGYN